MGKYLTALTTSFAGSDDQTNSNREPSIKRKRMHILYLINDVLYHSKYRINDASICSKIQPILVGLFGSAASFKGCPKHQRKVSELLDIWDEKGYYSKDYIDKLREAVKNAAEAGEYAEGSSTLAEKEQGLATKTAKSAPYVMPALHGDPSTPWFDLPAGNLMPHIIPNSTRPINPDMIKPLQFVAGPADENLILAVKALLEDVQTIFEGETDQEKASLDIDELGQPIILDEITGEVIDGEGYYGWSRSFCEKMKRRKKGLDIPGKDEPQGRSQSRSSSPDGRKRRYSDSDDGSSPDGYRSTRRRRSYSSSRSLSPEHARGNGNSGLGLRNRSYSRSPRRSTSPRRPENYPRDNGPPLPPQGLPPRPPIPPPPFQQPFNPNFPPPPIPNMPFNGQNQQFGAWPPPPLPLQNAQYNSPNQQQYGSWPPPPPPPPGNPPMNYQQQQQQSGYPPSGPGGWQQGNGRGYNNGNWNGSHRGGRGNYRGRGGGGGW